MTIFARLTRTQLLNDMENLWHECSADDCYCVSLLAAEIATPLTAESPPLATQAPPVAHPRPAPAREPLRASEAAALLNHLAYCCDGE